ncbi:MEDS domain-containing protein [Crossiella sp. SN42]|uniref:MEDS domain-containing protein n=1 Tax=Crossiella sp. SN42 TaxID=2944808 RepID=UPI00207CB3B3|nr:MEDS domain-containing protein [Crossiella sp. SN42]MCO1574354.1 MEDS domain-containing protein [Crossiella sp. SN42]
MRQSGVTEHARGLGPQDHLCWVYDDRAEFRRRAGEFLLDGLSLGQQVWYIAEDDPGDPAEYLGGHAELGDALRRGAARVVPLAAVCEPRAYDQATDRAVAEGYTGLRVAANCTPLAASRAFTSYERLVDQHMVARPFSAMCAYHRAELDEQVAEEIAALHPLSNTGGGGFRLYSSTEHAVTLTGELDLASRETFERAWRHAGPRPSDGKLVVDATGLDFLDHHSLLLMAEHAAAHGASLELHTRWPGAAYLVRLLNLPDVRVEEAE